MYLKKILTVIFVILSFYGCGNEKKKIYENLTYAQTKALAQEQGTPFCIIVADDGCGSCSDLKEELNTKYQKLLHKAVFNAVNPTQKEHRWFRDWLYTPSGPITCVFSANGDLLNVIEGANLKSIQTIEKAIDGQGRNIPLYYDSPLVEMVDIKDVVHVLDKALKYKLTMDNGENTDKLREASFDAGSYPFNLYLRCLDMELRGDSCEAAESARQLLVFSKERFVSYYFSDMVLKAADIVMRHEPSAHVHTGNCSHLSDGDNGQR